MVYQKIRRLWVIAALFLCVGCALTPTDMTSHVPALSTEQLEPSLAPNLKTLQTITPHLIELDKEFEEFKDRGGWKSRGYFNAVEANKIESLLFRFLTMHTALIHIVESYAGLDATFADDVTATKANVLSIQASLLTINYTASLIENFSDDLVAISQINQHYYRSEIPQDTYTHLLAGVTKHGIFESLDAARELFTEEMAEPNSSLKRLSKSDSEYRALITAIPKLQKKTTSNLHLIAKDAPTFADIDAIHHFYAEGREKRLYKVRSLTFKNVSRIKSPTAHLIQFSDAQKDEVHGLLQPGDIIITYTAGYMSDVFIPGTFKHGITYVGSPAQRRAAGLSPNVLPTDERYNSKRLAANLKQAKLKNGQSADVIEAIAEGVIFSHLETIMDIHINRMLVLRPKLTDAERAEFLVGVFSYLGDGYDFRFDFADASQQVCTEVIYRAINKKGAIDFPLTVRAGHETLSADDVANYHLNSKPPAFDFVLYAEADPKSKHHEARVLVGSEGEQRLKELMSSDEAK